MIGLRIHVYMQGPDMVQQCWPGVLSVSWRMAHAPRPRCPGRCGWSPAAALSLLLCRAAAGGSAGRFGWGDTSAWCIRLRAAAAGWRAAWAGCAGVAGVTQQNAEHAQQMHGSEGAAANAPVTSRAEHVYITTLCVITHPSITLSDNCCKDPVAHNGPKTVWARRYSPQPLPILSYPLRSPVDSPGSHPQPSSGQRRLLVKGQRRPSSAHQVLMCALYVPLCQQATQ
jgi:hypothetical protein